MFARAVEMKKKPRFFRSYKS